MQTGTSDASKPEDEEVDGSTTRTPASMRGNAEALDGVSPATLHQVMAQDARLAHRFRLYNPSIAWRHGHGLAAARAASAAPAALAAHGLAAQNHSKLRMFAKISSYSLCGASDE